MIRPRSCATSDNDQSTSSSVASSKRLTSFYSSDTESCRSSDITEADVQVAQLRYPPTRSCPNCSFQLTGPHKSHLRHRRPPKQKCLEWLLNCTALRKAQRKERRQQTISKRKGPSMVSVGVQTSPRDCQPNKEQAIPHPEEQESTNNEMTPTAFNPLETESDDLVISQTSELTPQKPRETFHLNPYVPPFGKMNPLAKPFIPTGKGS